MLFPFRSHFTAEKGGFFQGSIGEGGGDKLLLHSKNAYFSSNMASNMSNREKPLVCPV